MQGNSAAQPITLTGYIKGVGTFDNVMFTGTFDAGLSPTLMTVGNVALSPTSTLIMELGGTSRGSQYDAIIASGDLGLDGTLNVALIDGFSPSAGQAFDILDWATLTGIFDTLQLPALAGGLAWNTSQLYTTGVLSVATAGLLGDYNQNGTVDAADYVVWRKTLGQMGSSLAADGNGNGEIDPGDYGIWRANFGRTAGSGTVLPSAEPLSPAVPEPTTAFLLVSWVSVVALRHCRAVSRVPSTR